MEQAGMMQMVYEIRLEVPTEMDTLADSSVAVLAGCFTCRRRSVFPANDVRVN